MTDKRMGIVDRQKHETYLFTELTLLQTVKVFISHNGFTFAVASAKATFRQREEKLRKKDQVLQESLTRFNRFLQVSACVGTTFKPQILIESSSHYGFTLRVGCVLCCFHPYQETEAKTNRAENR